MIWEEVENRTSESTELSVSFVAFMALAMLIAAIGILLDQPILIIGAMVVGPEFGPLAGLSVAIVELRGAAGPPLACSRSPWASRSGVLVAYLLVEALRLTGLDPEGLRPRGPGADGVHLPARRRSRSSSRTSPGTAGVLSLTSAKSGALIGVLISVTTIPAAANIGVAAAYSDWDEMGGAAAQLGLNLFAIVLAGVATLYVQRRYYVKPARRAPEGSRPARRRACPLGRSAKETTRSRSSSARGRSPRR